MDGDGFQAGPPGSDPPFLLPGAVGGYGGDDSSYYMMPPGVSPHSGTGDGDGGDGDDFDDDALDAVPRLQTVMAPPAAAPRRQLDARFVYLNETTGNDRNNGSIDNPGALPLLVSPPPCFCPSTSTVVRAGHAFACADSWPHCRSRPAAVWRPG